MIHYSQCPVCKSSSINNFLSAKDNTVSNETFVICKCDSCTGLFTQNIPTQEAIGPYYASVNYISHSDTQEGLVNRLYHFVRKRTLVAKMKLVKAVTGLSAGNILDIGCGTGAFLNTMQSAAWKVTGLEPDATAREKARSLYNINPLASQEIFNLPASSFDAITLWHVLEHVHQLHEYVEQFKKLLTPKGRLIIAVPNYTSHDAVVYKEHWAAYDVPRHLYHFSPESIKQLMKQHGMQVKKIKPMWFDSFYVSMLSEQYKYGRSRMIPAFITGLSSNFKAMFDHGRCSSVIYVISKGEV